MVDISSLKNFITANRHRISRCPTPVKLVPLKDIKPTNKNINVPEAEHVMYIINELIKKIEIIDYLEVLVNNEDKLVKLIDEEFEDDHFENRLEKNSKSIEIFLSMCQNYRTLIKAYKNKSKRRNSTLQSRESMVMLIQSSTRDLLRVLFNRPKLFDLIKIKFKKEKRVDRIIYSINLKYIFNQAILFQDKSQIRRAVM
jgi:hypothetical protein